MSHVLVGGDERKVAALRVLLTRWGVTVGQLAFGDTSPTVQDCDAVILLGKYEEYRAACLGSLPDGSGGAAGSAAPLIFVNGEGDVPGGLPVEWMVLWQLDEDGGNLRTVLLSAFATARALRGAPTPGRAMSEQLESEDYLNFLGHELRSPLTAIKTSLEVLEGELGGVDSEQEWTESGLKMLAIALRNVRRLHRTVEWSQDLLAADKVANTFNPCAVATRNLAARFRSVGEVRLTEVAGEIELQTDPDVVAIVVTQMTRAVGMAAPDRGLTITMDLVGAETKEFQVMIAVADDGGARPKPNAARLGLVGSAAAADPVGELDRLAHFLVAPGLVQALGASLRTVSPVGSGPALLLSLDLAQPPLLV